MTWKQRVFTGSAFSGLEGWLNRLEKTYLIKSVQIVALNSQKILVLVCYEEGDLM
jgi:hypothetical protein